MIEANVFFTSGNAEPLDPVVQLIDSATKKCAIYLKCASSGTYVDDGVIYRKSVNTFYKSQIDNGVNVR